MAPPGGGWAPGPGSGAPPAYGAPGGYPGSGYGGGGYGGGGYGGPGGPGFPPPPRRRTGLIVAVVLVVIVLIAGAATGAVVLIRQTGSSDDSASQTDDPTDPSSAGSSGGSNEGGTSSESPDPTDSPTDSPTVAAPTTLPVVTPQVGECYDVTRKDITLASNERPTVRCAGATAQTIYVGRIRSTDPERVARAALTTCYQPLADALGTTTEDLSKSIITFVWFQPSPEQYAAGARWFRCDAVSLDGVQPQPLVGDLTGAYNGLDPTPRYRACLSAKHRRSLCTSSSSYHYAGVIEVDIPKLPSDQTLLGQATDRCPIAPGSAFYATWPSQTAWNLGDQRYVTCWTPS